MPDRFWDLCFEDTIILIQGYRDRVNEQWQQTRLIIYTIGCTVTEKDKRGEVYDLFYLPGDPTPEEREEAIKKEQKNLLDEQEVLNQQLREEASRAKIK